MIGPNHRLQLTGPAFAVFTRLTDPRGRPASWAWILG